MAGNSGLVMALPKGRILGEVMPLLQRAGIEPEPAFNDPKSRALRFATNEAERQLVIRTAQQMIDIILDGLSTPR